MFFTPLCEWVVTPAKHFSLAVSFIRQDFLSQFSGSVAGFLWLFIIPISHILIYSFVFGYIFQLRALSEFGETEFVLFMMVGYLPWFAFADAIGKSTSLLLEKAGLITKVRFPVQIIPITGTLIPYLTHMIGFCLLLLYLGFQGYSSLMWLLIPFIYFIQFLFTMGLVAILSALCVFLRDLQQIVSLAVTIWFFLTPIIYPINLIESGKIRDLFLFNPMHNFIVLYREIILLGELPYMNLWIVIPISLLSYAVGGWLFIKIKHTFGDVL
ncbi:MAG: ABC transporter permease [Gammaproteobacteria bacterium]|nr:ABC transporter permease [Gammaproteobacteria bacterium]